jgi:hypothetical protein
MYSTDAGLLAHALYDQGRFAEATASAKVCQATAVADDVLSQSLWRGVLAKVEARTGDASAALELAEKAVQLVAATDFLVDHADRLLDIAEVHALADRPDAAVSALDQADDLYTRKGCAIGVAETRRRRAALAEDY